MEQSLYLSASVMDYLHLPHCSGWYPLLLSQEKAFTNFVRALGALIFVPLGTLCVLAGLELDNIWYVSDLINIALVFANAPIILYGGKYVYRALKDYVDNDGKRFVAKNIGVESDIWKDE